jgi:hypothetical protein
MTSGRWCSLEPWLEANLMTSTANPGRAAPTARAPAPNRATAVLSEEQTIDYARQGVRDLLLKSEAFRALPKEQQREIAGNTVEVVKYLIAPDGIPGNKLASASPRTARASSAASLGKSADPYAFSLAGPTNVTSSGSNVNEEGKFVAQGAREGAAIAGALLQAVNFPDFVSGLINGVFHSIVDSSIKQMEAYGKLVADVAKSLNQFRDENVTENQGRDHLVEQFPDMFMIDVDTGAEGETGPRVRLRDGVDEHAALQKVNSMPMEGGPLKSLDLEDPETEGRVVQAARTQLATSRQQLLATMVLMGINRIIVTDGRISAKVMYDFQARDNFKFQRSATRFDHGDQMRTTTDSQSEFENRGYEKSTQGLDSSERSGGFYAKGHYKTTSEPVLKLVSASQQTTDASLTTKASLAGQVEVNFKSETFPLEKMADSFQIGMIQNAAKPASTVPVPASKGTSAPATTPAPSA